MLFLTGLLNSRLVKFWLKHRGKMQGQNFQIDKEPLLAIPLCIPKKAEQARIGKLVKRVGECTQRLISAKTDAESAAIQRLIEQCENQIQETIESLYDLDDEERKLLDR